MVRPGVITLVVLYVFITMEDMVFEVLGIRSHDGWCSPSDPHIPPKFPSGSKLCLEGAP